MKTLNKAVLDASLLMMAFGKSKGPILPGGVSQGESECTADLDGHR